MDTIKYQELMEETNYKQEGWSSRFGCAVSYLTHPCWQSPRPICFNEKHTYVNTQLHTLL